MSRSRTGHDINFRLRSCSTSFITKTSSSAILALFHFRCFLRTSQNFPPTSNVLFPIEQQNHWTQPVPPLRAPEPIAMYEVATPDNQPNLDDNPETEAMADDHLANIDLDPPHLNLPLDIDQDELDSQSPQQFYLQSQQNTAAPTTSEQETEYPWP